MLRNNLKLAWRSLSKNKGYTFLNVIGLSIGMAGALLIFLLLSFHLNTDRFHKNRNRVFRVVTQMTGSGSFFRTSGVPHPIGQAIRLDFPQIQQVAMIDQTGGIISIKDVKNNREKLFDGSFRDGKIQMVFVEPALFKILDYKWLAGNPAQALLKPNSVVITRAMAIKLFQNTNPLGKIITLEHKLNLKVTGVLSDYQLNTNFPFDFLISYSTHDHFQENDLKEWGSVSTSTNCLVLLPLNKQRKSIENLFPGFVKKNIPTKMAKGISYFLQPLNDIRFNNEYSNYSSTVFPRSLILTFISIGIVLLLTACINFINLSTAIAGKRSREVGVKKVLGSVPAQLFWQFITETALITFVAWLIALILSLCSLPLLANLFNAPVHVDAFKQPEFILFFGVLFILMVFLSGFYPGKILAGFKPIQALKNQPEAGKTKGFTLRKSLVVIQFTISQVLVFGTLVMIGQMNFIHNAELGFKKDALYLVDLPEQATVKAKLFRSRLNEITGIGSVSLSSIQPMSSSVNSAGFHFNNSPEDSKFDINVFAADSNYLKTYDIKLIAGKNIRSTDSVNGYLVNEAWIKQMGFKHINQAIGKNLMIFHNNAPIVGVIKDFHTSSFQNKIPPIFIASEKNSYHLAGIKLTSLNIIETKTHIEKIWKQVYPGFIYNASFFDDQIAKMYEEQENFSKIINGFALMAILIGCLGLFGLVSYTALQKTKEIGIRKVLGASSLEIMINFLKEFGLLLMLAFIISAPLGYWIMKGWLQDFEYRINISSSAFIFSLSISIIITLLTVSIRTFRASVANPVKSLRAD